MSNEAWDDRYELREFAPAADDAGAPNAETVVRTYLGEVASRWYGRPVTAAEVERALRDEPYDDLVGGTGVFLTARDADEVVACAGARFVGGGAGGGAGGGGDGTDGGGADAVGLVAEVTKVFTVPAHRGRGAGSALLRALEQTCRDRGAALLRLDTRAELAEACALYERLGYVRVEPFNDEPFSDRWYAKTLESVEP